jgi:hypothetical protein
MTVRPPRGPGERRSGVLGRHIADLLAKHPEAAKISLGDFIVSPEFNPPVPAAADAVCQPWPPLRMFGPAR